MSRDATSEQAWDGEGLRADYRKLRDALGSVLVGQESALDLTLAALLGGGHVLLEGPPGVGKTLLGRTLAELLETDYRRIQFTSDLMPSDIIGTYVIMESGGRRRFEFQQGPLFTNLLLADEINRATPKTQAALFEALDEQAVSVANERYRLPVPFFTIATQSLGEIEGTFPIPETQLDRFFFQIRLDQPEGESLAEILLRSTGSEAPAPTRVLDRSRLAALVQGVRSLPISSAALQLAANLVMATHPQHVSAPSATRRLVLRGSSPRGGQAMLLAARVAALADGRSEVSPEHVRRLAVPALRHRVVLNFEGHSSDAGVDGILSEILDAVK